MKGCNKETILVIIFIVAVIVSALSNLNSTVRPRLSYRPQLGLYNQHDLALLRMVFREHLLRNVPVCGHIYIHDDRVYPDDLPDVCGSAGLHKGNRLLLRFLCNDLPRGAFESARRHRFVCARALFHAEVDPQKTHSEGQAVLGHRHGSQKERVQTRLSHENDPHYAL